MAVPLHLVTHPVALDALAELRHKATRSSAFRAAAHRISTVVATEALRDLPSQAGEVMTPLGPAPARRLVDDLVLAPVLRAGLGMLEAVLALVPAARVGHIGLRRDEETAEASRYYARLPEPLAGCSVIVLDPMLATGGRARAALDLIKAAGARDLRLVCLVAAHLHTGRGQPPERAQVHRPWPGRLRGSTLRNGIAEEDVERYQDAAAC